MFNRIATNAQERVELFAHMDAHPDRIIATKSKLLSFYADQTNKTAQLPAPLDLSSISAPLQTCTGLNLTFSSPWPEFVESGGEENQWVAFQDKHGRMLMISRSTATNAIDDFASRELSFATNDSKWILALAFPDRMNTKGIDIYRQSLSIAPAHLSACTNMQSAFQYHARMTIKLLLLAGKAAPVIQEFNTGDYEGYQVLDASKPGRYHIRMFDRPGDIIELVFGYKNGAGASISQADVNCVLLSLQKIAQDSDAAFSPQGVESPGP